VGLQGDKQKKFVPVEDNARVRDAMALAHAPDFAKSRT